MPRKMHMVSGAGPNAGSSRGCPPWCGGEHDSELILAHSSTPLVTTLDRGRESEPEHLEVQTVHYRPLDTPDDGPEWEPTVELVHHSAGRCRVISLSRQEARTLAAHLTVAAAQTEVPGQFPAPEVGAEFAV